jgi:maleate cis-trans isomerase
MSFQSWRGTVGVVKPTHRPGSLEDFIRLLPRGIGVVPVYLGIKSGTEKEFMDVMDSIKNKVDELAGLGVDIIHPEGAPPFMIRGFQGEADILAEMERKHGKPVFTSGTSQVEALRALGVQSIVGITYFTGDINTKYARYFTEAGFEVLAMEGMHVPFNDVTRLSPYEIYAFVKQVFLKHPEADGVYLLGSAWHALDVVPLLEQDLQVPVLHPVPARVWATQKRLKVRQPVTGYGRLLEAMP